MNNEHGARRFASVFLGIILLIPLVSFASACSQSGSSAQETDGWILVWNDDFNGPANSGVNRENWLYDTGTGYGCPGCPAQWGTGEIETMTDSTENVSLDGGGHLVIKPIRAADGTWTSGRIETQRSDFEAHPQGILAVEASIQQPNVSGDEAAGYWSAFWMLGAPFRGNYLNWPGIGEIDIMEAVNGLSTVTSTLHCGTSPGGPCNEFTGLSSGQKACPGCLTDFHTYRVEIDRSVSPEQIRWYLDGEQYFQLEATVVDADTWKNATHHGFFIILNVAIGGGFPDAFGGGPTPAKKSGVPMLVDYVRVYQRVNTSVFVPFAASK